MSIVFERAFYEHEPTKTMGIASLDPSYTASSHYDSSYYRSSR